MKAALIVLAALTVDGAEAPWPERIWCPAALVYSDGAVEAFMVCEHRVRPPPLEGRPGR